MKEHALASILGVIGSAIASAFGGWNSAMTALIIFMAIDYISGLMVAGIFNNSSKSKTGGLESNAGFKGLCRKGVTLAIVLVASQLDKVMGSEFIRDACVIAFICNETISIIENAGLMGVPIPKALIKAIDILKEKSDEGNEEENTKNK